MNAKKVNGKAAPPSTVSIPRQTLPFAKPPNVSSPSVTQRIVVSHTFLLLFSATTTLYFFFVSFPYQLPASGRRQTFQPAESPRRRMMKFLYGGSSYRCYKCTGMLYILHPNQTMECQVWLLMDEKNAQTPPTIGLTRYPHIIILAIQLQQRKSRTASIRLDLPVCTLVINTLKRFSREPYSTSPTHAGTRVCVRRKWRQHRTGAGLFCQLIATMGMSQKNIFHGSGCSLFCFLSFSQHEFDFFAITTRLTDCLSCTGGRGRPSL